MSKDKYLSIFLLQIKAFARIILEIFLNMRSFENLEMLLRNSPVLVGASCDAFRPTVRS